MAESTGPLERGLAVLRVLSASTHDDRAVRHSDLVRATGLARATVDRVVSTLDRLGLVRGDGREVRPAPGLMALPAAYLRASGIPAALGPPTEELADLCDESVSVAVPDGDGVRFVLQHRRRRAMGLTLRLGEWQPAERCAPGALFAAQWGPGEWAAWRLRTSEGDAGADAGAGEDGGDTSEDGDASEHGDIFERRVAASAERGWAGDDQLLEPGLMAVSVPVRDPGGRIVCAVSVASHTHRHTLDSLAAALLPLLRERVGAWESALAAPRPSAPPTPVDDTSLAVKRELGPDFVRSLARGLAVLTALGEDRGDGLTLSETAAATGLARATARRSLLTLSELGYAEAVEGRFTALPRVLELGCARLSGLTLTDVARPHLEDLVGRVRESASLAVLDGGDIRYVARVPTVRIMSITITVGTRFPAYATSMGRVLLANRPRAERPPLPAVLPALTRHTVTSPDRLAGILDEVAANGHALVDQELEEGLRSLAVPVRDAGGRVVAALNVAQHTGHGSPDAMRAALLAPLRETAGLIERDLRALAAV
ncbi:IclR family transcriptional regulator C-terminal domain-containing protein [Streptomyces sp. NPDC059863]|uniref:IclR family transcriptional regulator domain-containing protein n=1 Tax=unclassified Streptomyces TaxID=2593676 RepID=UPI00366A026F